MIGLLGHPKRSIRLLCLAPASVTYISQHFLPVAPRKLGCEWVYDARSSRHSRSLSHRTLHGFTAGRSAVHDRDGLDLDEELRIDQPTHLQHTRRRADIAEVLAVRVADGLPVVDVGDEHPGPDDVR